MGRTEGLLFDALSSISRVRADVLAAIDDPVIRERVRAIFDRAVEDPTTYASRALIEAGGSPEAGSEARGQRTYVKVDGHYPQEMASFSRYKDRLSLFIGEVAQVPKHSISIEMIPVLRHFSSLSDRIDLERMALRRNDRCSARLIRAGKTMAWCHLEDDHDGDHMEIGSTIELDNWPPRALVRWTDDVKDFRPYHHSKPGTWEWEKDEELPWPEHTGRKSSLVKTLRGRYHIGHRRIAWLVRLPDSFDFFLLHNLRANPLAVFINWLAEELGGLREDWSLDVTEIHLIKSDYAQLVERERFWWARRGDETEANWTILDVSPHEVGFGEDDPIPEFVVPGWVYVGKKAVVRGDRSRHVHEAQGRAHQIELGPLVPSDD